MGAALAFDARIDGETLSFTEEEGRFVDDQTGSAWDLTGLALSGPLAGRRLVPAIGRTSFWYVWAAFNPDTEVFPREHASRPLRRPGWSGGMSPVDVGYGRGRKDCRWAVV